MSVVNYSFNLQVETGPSVIISGNYDVEAYDRISVNIKATEEEVVRVQPNDLKELDFIIIESSQYDPAGLTYEIIGDPANKKIPLDRAQFLVGKSLVELLPAVPQEIKFKNDLSSDVRVTILVGRRAIS
jgi:hypothetical protein